VKPEAKTDDGDPKMNEQTVEERLFMHEDDAFHNRTSWFLALHAALLAGYASVVHQGLIAVAVWVFGLLSAIGWLAVLLRQLRNLECDKKDFEEVCYAYKRRQATRRQRDDDRNDILWLGSAHATWVFGIVMPTAAFLSWLGAGILALLQESFPCGSKREKRGHDVRAGFEGSGPPREVLRGNRRPAGRQATAGVVRGLCDGHFGRA
jgi:hypothetical protein